MLQNHTDAGLNGDSASKTVYLHIGRHKTGTSTIQNFLSRNTDLLIEHNFYYPATGRRGSAHQQIAIEACYRFNRTAEDRDKTVESPLVKSFLDEIKNQPQNILLSSEAFQNSHPGVVQTVFRNYDMRILVYIRNQIDYLASAYAQKVWATRYCESMDHYYERIFNLDYIGFLDSWSAVSGGNVTVQKFSRNSLYQQDVVADFFERMLGIKDEALQKRIKERDVIDANPSLTNTLLAYKLLFNESNVVCDEAMERMFMYALAELSLNSKKDPVLVSSKIKELCIKDCASINKSVSDKYFDGGELFSLEEKSTGEVATLDSEVVAGISAQLVEIDSRIEEVIFDFDTTQLQQATRKAG